MEDLSINFGSLELKNPLVVSSGPISRDIRQVRKAEDCGASAVILKSILAPGVPSKGRQLRCYVDRKAGAIFGVAGGRLLTYEQGVDLVRTSKRETKLKIGVNILFSKLEDLPLYVDQAKGLTGAGADFVEINFSAQTHIHLGGGEKAWMSAGGFVRDLPRWAAVGIKAIKETVSVPVFAKLVPEGPEPVTMALAAESGGADGINAINSPTGAFQIDIFDEGRLKMPAAKSSGLTYSGALLKPMTQAIVARIVKAVRIPVMGTGGLMSWQDAVETIMFGASAVSFHTLLMIHGFEALTKIEKGLREFMRQQGYRRIEDFKSLALRYVADSRLACETMDCIAQIDTAKCTGCDICSTLAHCLAIRKDDEKPTVNEIECMGCGTCSLFCPVHAISMVEVQ